MPEQKRVKLFHSRHDRDGNRLVIDPVRKRGLIALLRTMKPLKETIPESDDPVPAPEKVL